jgi:hypothetical protein
VEDVRKQMDMGTFPPEGTNQEPNRRDRRTNSSLPWEKITHSGLLPQELKKPELTQRETDHIRRQTTPFHPSGEKSKPVKTSRTGLHLHNCMLALFLSHKYSHS